MAFAPELEADGEDEVPLVEGSMAEEAGGDAGEDAEPTEGCRQNRSGRVGVVLGLILLAKRRRGEIRPTGDSRGGVSVLPKSETFFLFFESSSLSSTLVFRSSGPLAPLRTSSTPLISVSILRILSCNSFHLDFNSAYRLNTSPFLVVRSAIPFPSMLSTRSHAGE